MRPVDGLLVVAAALVAAAVGLWLLPAGMVAGAVLSVALWWLLDDEVS